MDTHTSPESNLQSLIKAVERSKKKKETQVETLKSEGFFFFAPATQSRTFCAPICAVFSLSRLIARPGFPN